MHFTSLLAAVVALPILGAVAVPAATTTSGNSRPSSLQQSTPTNNHFTTAYEAPRPSGQPGIIFSVASGDNGGFLSATGGNAGGAAGGTAAPTGASGALGGSLASASGKLSGAVGPSGGVGCGGGAYGSAGTTICITARAAAPTA